MTYFLLYPLLLPLTRLMMRVLGRLRSSGEGHVPMRGPVLFCPTHVSDCDPVALFVSTPRRTWFLAKTELFDIPLLGWFFHHFHGLPIRRDSADRAALRRAENLLRRGKTLIIFPEGRVSEDGRLGPLQPGAALLSVRTGAPIVPVGLENTDGVLPYGQLIPRYSRRPVVVSFGPPIRPEEFADLPRGKRTEAMTRRLASELARLTHQPPPR